jgi:hypothetical protein
VFSSLICPISTERIDQRAVRLTAGAVAVLTASYIATGWRIIPLLLLFDFASRGFGAGALSPLRVIAAGFARRLGSPSLIDKAPKLFAARVGMMFSLAILGVSIVSSDGSRVVAAVLVLFALLESVFNICAGCLVYSYLVAPYFRVTAPGSSAQ